MKIGMLTDVYKPVLNGITNFISLCKREMEAAGHQVTVFTFGHLDRDDEPGVIRSPAIPLSDTGYHFNLVYSREAREMLHQMDILHAHHPFISGRIATRYGRQLNLPIVFTNHTRYDLYAQAYLPMVPPALTNIVMETFMPSFTALCDLVIAPSAGLKQVLVNLGVNDPIEIIPNGIDLSRLYHPTHIAQRSELDIPPDAQVLVYCGRLGPEKNLDFLLQAFSGAVQAVPSAYLMLVGGGPAEDEITVRALQIPHVRIVGPVDYADVPAYLAAADIFATASISEVHPLSVIEALAAGLPILGIDSPGVTDTVRNGVDGYLTQHDLAAFSAMMVRMLLQPSERKQMALAARERSSSYSIKTCAANLVAQYQRLINETRQRPPKEKLWQALAREVSQVLGE